MGEFDDLDFFEEEEENNEEEFTPYEQFLREFYKKDIELLAERYPEEKSLVVDFSKIEEFDPSFADELLQNPDFFLQKLKNALIQLIQPVFGKEEFSPNVRIKNLPKEEKYLIREINAEHIGRLIAIEGVIRQITDVLPRVEVAAFRCLSCGKEYKIKQDGVLLKKPKVCEVCGKREFELLPEKSKFVNYQKLLIQEPLEYLKGGEQASNLVVLCSDDLTNLVKPGDRIIIVGILRLDKTTEKRTVYKRFLEAIYIESVQKEFEEVEITHQDVEEIRKLARDKNIYDKIIDSIAPAIYGHRAIKEAIALQMFGGVKKELPAGARIRGNIHILLMGDPGVGKSQLLQYANMLAPKSIYVAGKTASGVGLTASAVKDEFGEGGWTLKAGALVLASGGFAMIDELDKMSSDDRNALHEAMEQESVSVAKAGIITTFKAETSVLAAANPKYGRFDRYTNPIEQINIPPSLLSRFDLMFTMFDEINEKQDSKLAEHVLKMHHAGEVLARTGNIEEIPEGEKNLAVPVIEPSLLKKYIAYARKRVFPVMTREAMKKIMNFYVHLRKRGLQTKTIPITPRQLEGLIRLAEASARVRLDDKVREEDAERAIRLFKVSMQEVGIDQEQNAFDVTILYTGGKSSSHLNALKEILRIIKTKAQEFDKVAIEDVLDEAEALGIDREKAKDIIQELKKSGEIYEPKHGFILPVNREE